MKLSNFERQSLNCLKEAVEEVYREAMRDNRKLVVGDYKGNPRLIDPSEAFKKVSTRSKILKKLRSNGAKMEKSPEPAKKSTRRPMHRTSRQKTFSSIS
ncbi:MAG TPA: hypothetical protein PK581_08635 [Caldisericia bacterium]|nr:hypothetical protein [Caldisericia bacterium]